MATYSAGGRFTLQVTGTNNNTWGVVLNNGVFQLVDDAIFGRAAFTLSGTKTLTSVNGATDEARNAILDVTGGTGGTVTIPSSSKIYMGRNNAAGNVIITTGGVTSVTLQTGDIMPTWTDGSAVYTLMLSGLNLRDYISAAGLNVPGTLPAQFGNAGKFIKTDGTNATWQQVQSADIGDIESYVRQKVLVYTLIFGGS